MRFGLAIMGSIGLVGCDSETEVFYLDHYRIESTQEYDHMNGIYSSDPKGNKLVESVIMKHPPTDIGELRALMLLYFDSLQQASTDSLLSERKVSFYRYSRDTKHFITAERAYEGFGRVYLYDREDDYLGKIVFRRYFDRPNEEEFLLFNFKGKVDTIKNRVTNR